MGLGMEKCCCCIPLRLGTLIIAVLFFAIYLADAITGFLGVNSIIVFSGLDAKQWYYADLVFTLIISAGGFFGIIGSLFANRKFVSAFSIILWIACALSFVKYLVSLVLLAIHQDSLVNVCMRSGLTPIAAAGISVSPSSISTSSYYSPVRYPGSLNANAASEETCEGAVRTMVIIYGVVMFVVEVIQIYFAMVVKTYQSRLRNGARHHRLHDQQIKDFEDHKYHMSTVY